MVVSSAYQAAALMSVISFAGALVFVGCGRLASKFGIDDEKAVSFFDATCLTLAAAAMIGDACLHLIPETFEGTDEDTADRYGVLLVTGVVAVLAFEKICDACLHLIPETFEGTDEDTADRYGVLLVTGVVAVLAFEKICDACNTGTIEPFGVANLLVEGLHNFADGMALQVAWTQSTATGVATTIAVAVHELPQELGDFAVLRRAGFATGPLLAANFVASLTCFGGVALAASPWVAEREDEMVAFTAGSFLALALHSLAPRALATLDDAQTAQGRALRAVWLLALVLGVVHFLQFVGELEHAVPAAEESSSGFGSFFGRGKEL